MSGWSAEQRATVARLLAESIDPSPATMRSPVRRSLVLTVWLRRQVAVIALVVTSTLLLCDLWFDVCLSWGTAEHWSSVAAALVELPVANLLATSAGLLMRRSFTVIARLRGQDETAVPLWRQPMIHFTPPAFDGEDESAGRTR